jgi:hypothetical protein
MREGEKVRREKGGERGRSKAYDGEGAARDAGDAELDAGSDLTPRLGARSEENAVRANVGEDDKVVALGDDRVDCEERERQRKNRRKSEGSEEQGRTVSRSARNPFPLLRDSRLSPANPLHHPTRKVLRNAHAALPNSIEETGELRGDVGGESGLDTAFGTVRGGCVAGFDVLGVGGGGGEAFAL